MGCIAVMMKRFKASVCVAFAGVSVVSMSDGRAHEAPVSQQRADVRSVTLPVRKDGLWAVTVRSDDLVLRQQGQAKPGPVTVQMCTRREVEPVMLLSMVPGQENCQKLEVVRLGKTAEAGFEVRSTCQVHDVKSEMQLELRGDLQARYHGSFSVNFPQMPMQNTGRMVFEGRWLGECAAGQRPGDIRLPNGATVNVVEARQRAEKSPEHDHQHKH
jgi:hypothetical protein